MAGEIKIPLSSFSRKMGRKKDLSIFTHMPPSFPTQRHSAWRPVQLSELSGWQLSSSTRLVLRQQTHLSDIPSPEKQTLWKFSSNKWECSLWLPHSGSLDYPAGSSFQTRTKTSPQNRSGAGKTHHSTSILSSQRAPIRGCLFLIAMHHHRKHFRKRLQLFCQRLPTLLDWPLGNDAKNKFTGLEVGKKDLN